MKNLWIYSTLTVAALGIGGWLLLPRAPVIEESAAVILSEPEVIPEQPKETVVDIKIAIPEFEINAPVPPAITKPAPRPVRALLPEKRRRMAVHRYYDQMERNFEQQLHQLEQETDPIRRKNIITSMGRYVRIDTLAALNWAATLEDREEQRAALEAINRNALTGIGARIEMDDYGLPKIKSTTLLSAAESTGKIQAGDYISGMVAADGRAVSFRGLTMQQIVASLRGPAGSIIQLKLERSPEYESTQPIPFDVSLQRSLIVMAPPSDG